MNSQQQMGRAPPSDAERLLIESGQSNRIDADARIDAVATRVTKCQMMRTIIMEELPEPHRLKKLTMLYLIPESIICIYLLFCLVYIDGLYQQPLEDRFTWIMASLVFLCLIPFMGLRVISLLCCMSVRRIPTQFFGIWVPNLLAYAVWSSYAIIEIIVNGKPEDFYIDFFNTVLMVVILSTSIGVVICGLPLFIFKLYERAEVDKSTLAKKIGQIKLLPKTTYRSTDNASMAFCTICLDNFKHARSRITYLPCDPRHYFHTKCIKNWLIAKQQTCPLCKMSVDFKKSISHDQTRSYEDLLQETTAPLLHMNNQIVGTHSSGINSNRSSGNQ